MAKAVREAAAKEPRRKGTATAAPVRQARAGAAKAPGEAPARRNKPEVAGSKAGSVATPASDAAGTNVPARKRAAGVKAVDAKTLAEKAVAAKPVRAKAGIRAEPAGRPPGAASPVERAPEKAAAVNLGFLSDYIGFHLRLAQDASYRVFSRMREKDLVKPGRFPALAIIHLNPGISQSALGRAIARDKSTISPLIRDLEVNGFIDRKPSDLDRRSVTLTLTKKGERTLTKLHTRATEHEEELERLIGSARTRLLATLGKIIDGMAALDPA